MAQRTVRDVMQSLRCQRIVRRMSLSSTNTTAPAWPRTDLKDLRRWEGMDAAVEQNAAAFDSTPVADSLAVFLWEPDAINEEGVVYHAKNFLGESVVSLMQALGVKGRFDYIGGLREVVAAPDLVWLVNGQVKPKFLLEFKTPWTFTCAESLHSVWPSVSGNPRNKVVRAVSQLYGYLTFNHLRYGALSTYDCTWFFCRTYSESGGLLEVAGPYSILEPARLLEAYLTVLLLAEENWFHASPTSSPGPARKRPAPAEPTSFGGECIKVEARELHFVQGKAHSRSGAVVKGTWRGSDAIFKVVDKSKHEGLALELAHEARIYCLLASQQGCTVPRLLGFVEVWDMLLVLIMESAGEPLPDYVQRVDRADPHAVDKIRSGCRAALAGVHAAGLIHGDVRPENFVCREDCGGVVVVDFGLAEERPVDETFEKDCAQEMGDIDWFLEELLAV